ncbi:MAG: alcohol dehydrogenase catalytic domain-containing protein [Clostridia bacterium]|nr:alcohol dehydrogenase catalytic domain-containing protein [Clostridia bacterium]
MKAVGVLEPGKIQVVDIPAPRYGDYECLVRIRACGVCNCTDIEIINDTHVNQSQSYPLVIGHEGAGEIVELGKKVKNYRIGDRIVFPEGRIDPESGFCARDGQTSEFGIVRDVRAMNADGLDGGDYEKTFPREFPGSISFEDAGVLVPVRETFSGMRNLGAAKGSKVLIFGDGPNGLGLSLFARILGADWVGVVGHRKNRLEHIRDVAKLDLVIDSNEADPEEVLAGKKLDLVVDGVGKTDIILKGSRMVREGGKVGLYAGVHKPESLLPLYEFANNVCFHKHFFPSGDLAAHDEVIQMILDGKVKPSDFYSHVVPIDDYQKAVDMTLSREAFKVVVKI